MKRFNPALLNSGSFKTVEYFEETDSTQSAAKAFVRKNGVRNALFIADRQTGGRGRMGRSWSGGDKGLAFSLLLRPKTAPERSPLVNFAAGLAMKRCLKSFDIEAELKWPNDLLRDGRKLCGILSETASVLDSLFYVVTGVGLNVNEESFEGDLRTSAVSMLMITGREFSREKVLSVFIAEFEKSVKLLEDSPCGLLAEYRKSCGTIGKRVRIISDESGSFAEGLAEDVLENGALLLNKNGEKQSFLAADVVHLRNAQPN